MWKSRKFISLAVVFTMLCSLLFPAFSYANDIEGTKYEEAIVKLAALDTIKGYEDGSFKPENTITRAELATIITFVLGLQDAADLAKDNPTNCMIAPIHIKTILCGELATDSIFIMSSAMLAGTSS